ncbi:hypothetical protein FA13DRAFT_120371 [Coprinellus micaceus]|uniref:Uncharacterized protein n=1 Tax=Coprinellus micaceus TaxID=71717 RepID=A0A4Y7TIC5_COPMI|nr:hypothetical protein FA13DRAFT_120371 [Coprinellus micaceus]
MAAVPSYYGWPRLDVANLIAALVETILLGHYLSLLFRTYETMLRRSKETKNLLRSPLFWVSLLMFASILGNWITVTALVFKAFVLKSGVVYVLGPDQSAGQEILPSIRQYLRLSDPWNVANTAFYAIGTCVCNAFIIYRLLIVWSRRWAVIVAPLIMLVALVVTASMAIRHFAQSPDSSIYTSAGPWVTATFVLTLACNIYSTGLIMWRIYQSNRSMKSSGTEKFGQSLTQKISDMLIQSASLYSTFLTISLVTYVADSNLVFISTAITMPIIVGSCVLLILPTFDLGTT